MVRSQLTAQISAAGDFASPPTQLDCPLQRRVSWHSHRSPLATALTHNFLGAFAITDQIETTASTNYLLGVFGFADHLEKRVQRLDAEPANGLRFTGRQWNFRHN